MSIIDGGLRRLVSSVEVSFSVSSSGQTGKFLSSSLVPHHESFSNSSSSFQLSISVNSLQQSGRRETSASNIEDERNQSGKFVLVEAASSNFVSDAVFVTSLLKISSQQVRGSSFGKRSINLIPGSSSVLSHQLAAIIDVASMSITNGFDSNRVVVEVWFVSFEFLNEVNSSIVGMPSDSSSLGSNHTAEEVTSTRAVSSVSSSKAIQGSLASSILWTNNGAFVSLSLDDGFLLKDFRSNSFHFVLSFEVLQGLSTSRTLAKSSNWTLLESLLSVGSVNTILSNLVAWIVQVPQLLEGQSGLGSHVNTPRTSVVIVRLVSVTVPRPSVFGHYRSPGRVVIDINSKTSVMVGSSRSSSSGNSTETEVLPSVKKVLLRKSSKSRVDCHGGSLGIYSSNEFISSRSLQPSKSSRPQTDVFLSFDALHRTRALAKHFSNELFTQTVHSGS
mmetsp:Transcript_22822/g.31799  ORF Transcript_22822/g.31799 Transcript_22822/m.31799 type:complete len:446 (-) Transcript_22822:125-1462(-)